MTTPPPSHERTEETAWASPGPDWRTLPAFRRAALLTQNAEELLSLVKEAARMIERGDKNVSDAEFNDFLNRAHSLTSKIEGEQC